MTEVAPLPINNELSTSLVDADIYLTNGDMPNGEVPSTELPSTEVPKGGDDVFDDNLTVDSKSISNGSVDDSCDSEDGTRLRSPSTGKRYMKLKDDEFVAAAGLTRTAASPRKSSMERLIEQQLNTGEDVQYIQNDKGDRYILRKGSTHTTTTSSDEGIGEEEPRVRAKKGSVYEQRNIEAPTRSYGDRISNRTNHLLEQYEKDMSAENIEKTKPVETRRGSVSQARNSYVKQLTVDETKAETAKEEKQRELEEVKRLYKERLNSMDGDDGENRIPNKDLGVQDIKARKTLGSLKDKYMARAHGQKIVDSDDDSEQEQHADEKIVDGKTVVVSSNKIEVVKSSEGVGNIKNAFAERQTHIERKSAKDEVDSESVSSAMSLFKKIERVKHDTRPLNKPPSVRVKDPKTLMELRKKMTYGDDEDVPQDGVVRKSVDVKNDEAVKSSSAKESLALYKKLESTKIDNSPVNKPKARLISEGDVKGTMDSRMRKTSESSDTLDTSIGPLSVNTDNVSGYYSGEANMPTSPSSVGSDSLSLDSPADFGMTPTTLASEECAACEQEGDSFNNYNGEILLKDATYDL